MYKNVDNILIEDARIIFRNFRGEPNKYNRAGDRNFGVIIEDSDFANRLNEEGWNVKILKPRDEQEDVLNYIKVSVNYDYRPPKVYLVTRKGKVLLDDESIGNLDDADIKHIDLSIRPYYWENENNSGIKAYLKTMYVVIEEDEFESKYD